MDGSCTILGFLHGSFQATYAPSTVKYRVITVRDQNTSTGIDAVLYQATVTAKESTCENARAYKRGSDHGA